MIKSTAELKRIAISYEGKTLLLRNLYKISQNCYIAVFLYSFGAAGG